MYINDILVQLRSHENTEVFAYADDLILFSSDLPALISSIQLTMSKCEDLDLIINKNKSEIIIIGKESGPSFPRSLLGIPIKKKAKYLGLTYNNSLNIDFSIKAFEPKVKYIFHRLFRTLK
jgi:hypothetical protein